MDARRWTARLAALAMAIAATPQAFALDHVRLGTSGVAIIWTIVDMGRAAGTWKAENIEVESLALSGDAAMQQALAAGAIDIGFGSGPGLGYRAKGVPALCVAALAGPPYNFVLAAAINGPVRTLDDLKGRRVGVTSAGSMTDWLVRETARRKGWGPDGIMSVPLGAERARLAAMKGGDIDASVVADQIGFSYEERGVGRVVAEFGDIVKAFHTHVAFARDDLRQKNPDLVRRFLRAWFASVAWAKAHRAEGEAIAAKAIGVSGTAIERAWDNEMRMLSDDGALDPAAIDTIRRSLPELGMLDAEPEAASLYTTDFTPVRARAP